MSTVTKILIALGISVAAVTGNAWAFLCNQGAPSYGEFKAAVEQAYNETQAYGFPFVGMWATLMDTTGTVCWVYTVDGETATDNGGIDAGNTAWLGSRVISAQKANTANAFSLDAFSIPTGAVTIATYEGGSLFGLQASNPVDTNVAYRGNPRRYGTNRDPLRGRKVGGVNLFGGGIALYQGGVKVGAVGVSGDTSCRDHSMAFSLRKALGMDTPPNDDTLYLVPIGQPLTGLFQQPACGANDPNDPAVGVVSAP